MNPSADCGGVSRPSSQAWIATGSSCWWPRAIAATRCRSRACTPPFPSRPIKWSVPLRRFTPRHSSTSAGKTKNSPDSIACEMRTMSCGTTRPAPRFKCPTSLFPICPAGSPTGSPDALRSVRGALAQRRCQVGVSPSSTALPSRPGRKPQPSSTIRTTGVRGPCLFAILEGMQSSRALRALPVVLWLAPTPPLIAQARYRVTTDGAWFYQEAGGKRLARLARGAVVSGGDQQGDWQGVTLEGWIFTTSVGPTARAGYDLAVTRAPEENLRSAPAGALVGKLPQGFLLNRVAEATTDRWVHVTGSGEWTRVQLEGWVKTADLHSAPPGVLVGVSAAELRADPPRYVGQLVRWTLEFISLQRADELRPEIPTGATYMLARGPLPERGFVYVIVPEAKRVPLEALTPLAVIEVTARARAGRSQRLRHPVADLTGVPAPPQPRTQP